MCKLPGCEHGTQIPYSGGCESARLDTGLAQGTRYRGKIGALLRLCSRTRGRRLQFKARQIGESMHHLVPASTSAHSKSCLCCRAQANSTCWDSFPPHCIVGIPQEFQKMWSSGSSEMISQGCSSAGTRCKSLLPVPVTLEKMPFML